MSLPSTAERLYFSEYPSDVAAVTLETPRAEEDFCSSFPCSYRVGKEPVAFTGAPLSTWWVTWTPGAAFFQDGQKKDAERQRQLGKEIVSTEGQE